uniref:Uncharacterized protein stf15 n=1 Tax=Sorogena stoianovitchae TaxID=164621 RepID=B1B3Q1_SORST|nr:hypothetical protein [Sorogena stoianovitchae]
MRSHTLAITLLSLCLFATTTLANSSEMNEAQAPSISVASLTQGIAQMKNEQRAFDIVTQNEKKSKIEQGIRVAEIDTNVTDGSAAATAKKGQKGNNLSQGKKYEVEVATKEENRVTNFNSTASLDRSSVKGLIKNSQLNSPSYKKRNIGRSVKRSTVKKVPTIKHASTNVQTPAQKQAAAQRLAAARRLAAQRQSAQRRVTQSPSMYRPSQGSQRVSFQRQRPTPSRVVRN